MAQNLNYQTGKSWCYKNDTSNCGKYGRLYDWNTAKTACPTGSHLPSYKEWVSLLKAAGGDRVFTGGTEVDGYCWDGAGKKLKSKTGWKGSGYNGKDDEGSGTDDYGFSAMPGGMRGGYDEKSFSFIGEDGYWWTATRYNSDVAYYQQVGEGFKEAYYFQMDGEDCVNESIDWGNNVGRSVRCIID